MKSFVAWIQAFAAGIGGPGLFIIAFLDSSFVSLPQINDLLVISMVIQHPTWMPYYAGMATLGSVAGCLALYVLARKGGDAFIRRRFKGRTLDRATRLVQKYGVLSLVIPAILPPPAPFKLFVLLAGVSNVGVVPFMLSIAAGRGLRYFAIGLLTVWYGQRAVSFLEENGTTVAVAVAVAAAIGIVAWIVLRRYRRREPALTSAG